MQVLPFEAPIVELFERVKKLRQLTVTNPLLQGELDRVELQSVQVAKDLFSSLSPMQKVQLSRHANRPYTLDYIDYLFSEWEELHGDRRYGEDASIVAGLARYRGRSVVLVGHQKGRGTKENVKRNFGMPHPEGYRKAIRLFQMAERFRLPVVTFIDTPGAYPGLAAEERGQSEAIGAALAELSSLTVPVIATVIGEGGSGGALALGLANKVFMLEYSCYSVISPEGCAAILWKESGRAPEAAEQLKLTAPDLLRFGIIDGVIEEPPGGAHHDPKQMAQNLDTVLKQALDELTALSPAELQEQRYQRFRKLGQYQQ
jgi:acetyl-CoA carboxylase carboxyl transferase subunit alpha